MRLVTFNVMSGRSLADGLVDPDRFHAAIAGLDADVLALQEVDRGQPRSGGHDLTAIAAAAVASTATGTNPAGTYTPGTYTPGTTASSTNTSSTNAVASRFAATVVGTPGGLWRPARDSDETGSTGPNTGTGPNGGAGPNGATTSGDIGTARYGVALISRWPVRGWYLRRMRAAPIRAPIYQPGPGGGVIMLTDEPRVVLAAVIDSPAGPLTVACTHLSFVPGWNVGQLTATLRWLGNLPGPRYLLGDLNLPAVATLPIVRSAGWLPLGRLPTYPSPRPRVQFDHILAHRQRPLHRPSPALIRVETPLIEVSDHRPLVVELAD